jgi:hypothetical protein
MRLCPQCDALVDLIATMGHAERRILMLTMQQVIALQDAGDDDEAAAFLEDLHNVLTTPSLRRELALKPLSN